ncbi:hypothetical protein QAD02_004831 [Eretmocerus hayati]|uniref:Uncharacterized protein n=1 Tax=Eretmocerus hayati TaxID=131215 RepID=A0ACC2NQQ6_9HYME|nr:hypothetical protein QAD02_004831 [Eretmocerus hayati]
MTSCGMEILNFLLLCSSLLSLGGNAKTEERRINLNGYYDLKSQFVTRGDGSLVFTSCKIFVRQLECIIWVVGLSGSVIKYPFTYKGIVDLVYPSATTSFDMIENVAYVKLDENDPQHRYYVTILAVDLTSGSVSKLDLPPGLPYQDDQISLIIDYNGANLILKDPSVCGDHMPRCKFTFNKRGKRLAGPISFPIDDGILQTYPRIVKSADRGMLISHSVYQPESGRIISRIFYIDASGNATELRGPRYFRGFYSDTSDQYLVCALSVHSNEVRDCVQYDWKLNETIASTLSMEKLSDEGNTAQPVSIAILDKSKYLVLYYQCGKDDETECKSLRVSSINSDGNVLKTTRLFDFVDSRGGIQFIQGASVAVENQFCFYIIYYGNENVKWAGDHNTINVNMKCIPKSDL